jgi:hypothetical protein
MDVEIPSIIHFLWLRGASNERIMAQIKETYRDGVIYLQSLQRWSQDFAEGRTELDALPRPGRQTDPENADLIMEFLENKPYLSQNVLSRRLNLHHDPAHRSLRQEFGLPNLNFEWIPHSPTESHKQERVRASMELLRFLEESSLQKLTNLFTSDESWFYLEILGTQCGSHPEFSGQQESEAILEFAKL